MAIMASKRVKLPKVSCPIEKETDCIRLNIAARALSAAICSTRCPLIRRFGVVRETPGRACFAPA
jgi:hypothetical protein